MSVRDLPAALFGVAVLASVVLGVYFATSATAAPAAGVPRQVICRDVPSPSFSGFVCLYEWNGADRADPDNWYAVLTRSSEPL